MKSLRGFTLVTAIFVLVIVGLLGSYLVQTLGAQTATVNYSLQGVRAYVAARGGLEWALGSLSGGANCSTIGGASFTLNGFSVSLTCSSQSFTEGSSTYNVYNIVSTSQTGTFGTNGYIMRKAQVNVTQ
jgi:MSHA biogenesis protein MshP